MVLWSEPSSETFWYPTKIHARSIVLLSELNSVTMWCFTKAWRYVKLVWTQYCDVMVPDHESTAWIDSFLYQNVPPVGLD